MNAKWLLAPILLLAALLIPSVTQAATSASFVYTLDNGAQSTTPALLKSGTVYASAGVLESAGLQVSWDKSHHTAKYAGWQKSVVVTVGSKTGILDGKKVNLGGIPFVYNEQLFVHARFIVQALEGESVSWSSAQAVYKAKGIQSFASDSAKYGGLTYLVDKNTGKLYVTNASGTTRLLANLGSELYDMVTFDFKRTDAGLIYLTITDVYGEPHINNKWYTLIIKDGMVIRQASVRYHIRYGYNVKMYGNRLLLTDGKTLRLIEDGTGKVAETLDLAKLGGEDDNYLVEGMDEDFLLIRPNQQGLLQFIDRKTGAKTLLYKELLDAEQQKYAETNDLPSYGDSLKFIKREGNTLLFKNELVQDDQILKFVLPGAQKE